MKTVFLLLSLIALLHGSAAYAQISIFNQKSTQTKYMVQQIAALKVYTDYLKKGYSVIKDGTGLIKDIKNGEFGLHKKYFGSLTTVSGPIKKHPKAAAIYKMLSAIESQRMEFYSIANFLPGAQRADLKATLQAIATQIAIDLDELLLVLQDGGVEMTDDQRIKRIDDIYARVQKVYSWQRQLFKGTKDLIRYLEESARDLSLQRKLQ